MKKLFLLSVFILASVIQAFANDYTDENGVTWTFYTGVSVGNEYHSDWVYISSAANYGDEVVVPEYVYSGETKYTVVRLSDVFSGNKTLKKVTLPVTVKLLYNTFNGCSSLTEVENTAQITSVGYGTFWGTSIETADLSSCTTIDTSAFYECHNLKSAKLSSLCKSIGSCAFQSCDNLTSVGDLSGCEKIGGSAFQSTKITSVDLSSCKTIDNSAFAYCSALESVGNTANLQSVGSSAFNGCSSLKAINLSNCQYAGEYAFSSCASLEEVDLTACKMLTEGLFSGCVKLKKIVGLEKYTAVPNAAFRDCTSITSVDLPLCTSIGDQAFYSCTNLASVDLPLCTSIGASAFRNCTNLAPVDLPLCTSIGDQAFYSCTNLASVNLPQCTSIGDQAFYGCTSLASATIPLITQIPDGAFYGCENLQPLDMTKFTSIGSQAFANCSFTKVDLPVIESLGYRAFEGCDIATASFPETLKSLGYNCFDKATVLLFNGTTPPAITVDNAHNPAPTFSTLTMFKVPEAALDAYKTADVWSDYAARIFSLSDNFDYTDVTTTAQDKTSGLQNAIGQDDLNKVVTLKAKGTINSYDLMVIRNKMPNLHYLDLADVDIVANDYEYYTGCHTTDSVVGSSAFHNLSKLVTVKLPNSAKSIESSALSNCSNLKEVTFPAHLKTIGNSAFSSDGSLTRIELPVGVTTIGSSAFQNCFGLKEAILPSGLERIEYEAFYYCSYLSHVEFPPTLKYIGSRAFCGCSSLKNIELPGLEQIAENAFNYCSGLEEVRVPSTLNSIGDQAFSGCSKLQKVYTYTVEPVSIDQNTFSTYSTATLYIPTQSRDNYYWNTQWSQFSKLVDFDEPYKYFYLNKEYTLNDRFDGTPDIDVNPGGGLILPDDKDKGDQEADTVHVKADGSNWASIIANGNLNAKGLYIDITIKANKWYFFSFPFPVKKDNIFCGKNTKYVFRYYDGSVRADKGKGGWTDVPASETWLKAGKGYIFQASLDCTLSIKIEKGDFGKLPNIDVDTKLDIHPSDNEQNASWNFIGNPFTSFFNVNDMGYDSPVTRWNSDSNTYEALRPGDDDYTFHPFEAFFVQRPNNQSEITFAGDSRMTQTGSEKRAEAAAQALRSNGLFHVDRQLVNLTLTDGTTTDKTRVVFNQAKSQKYEMDCDAAKFESAGATELYSVEAQSGKLAINERPEGSVQLGYRAAKAGNYTLSAARMDKPVLLRDNALNITYDLTNGDYQFSSEAGTFDNRFMLLVDKSATGIADIVTATGVNIKPCDTGINITGTNGKTVSVYGANGALFAKRSVDGFLTLGKGVYVVEVEGMKTKVMVK